MGLKQDGSQGTGPDVLSLFQDMLNSGSDLRVRVTGRSMAPFLRGGEILTLRKVPPSSLKKGDLIFFRNRDGYPTLHRIIRAIRRKSGVDLFQTKGDALVALDLPIPYPEVLGKVYRIERGEKEINLETVTRSSLNYLIAVIGLLQSTFFFSLSALKNLIG